MNAFVDTKWITRHEKRRRKVNKRIFNEFRWENRILDEVIMYVNVETAWAAVGFRNLQLHTQKYSQQSAPTRYQLSSILRSLVSRKDISKIVSPNLFKQICLKMNFCYEKFARLSPKRSKSWQDKLINLKWALGFVFCESRDKRANDASVFPPHESFSPLWQAW